MTRIGVFLAVGLTAGVTCPTLTAQWSKSAAPVTVRTIDGVPEPQGSWVNNSATPLQRPEELRNRPFLTDEEVATLQARADRLFKGGDSDFATADNAFLAALADAKEYRNPGAELDLATADMERPHAAQRDVLLSAARQKNKAEYEGPIHSSSSYVVTGGHFYKESLTACYARRLDLNQRRLRRKQCRSGIGTLGVDIERLVRMDRPSLRT